jgi:hypothetical protein
MKKANGSELPEKNLEAGPAPEPQEAQTQDTDVTGEGAVSPLSQAIVEEKYDNSPLLSRLTGYRTITDSFYRTINKWSTGHEEYRPDGRMKARYKSIAVTALEQARQFLGVILREKGASYPYPKDNASGTVADQGEAFEVPEDIHEAVKFLRDGIEDMITEWIIYIDQVSPVGPKDFVCQNAYLQKLVEAKMALGEIFGVLAETLERAGNGPGTTLSSFPTNQ